MPWIQCHKPQGQCCRSGGFGRRGGGRACAFAALILRSMSSDPVRVRVVPVPLATPLIAGDPPRVLVHRPGQWVCRAVVTRSSSRQRHSPPPPGSVIDPPSNTVISEGGGGPPNGVPHTTPPKRPFKGGVALNGSPMGGGMGPVDGPPPSPTAPVLPQMRVRFVGERLPDP